MTKTIEKKETPCLLIRHPHQSPVKLYAYAGKEEYIRSQLEDLNDYGHESATHAAHDLHEMLATAEEDVSEITAADVKDYVDEITPAALDAILGRADVTLVFWALSTWDKPSCCTDKEWEAKREQVAWDVARDDMHHAALIEALPGETVQAFARRAYDEQGGHNRAAIDAIERAMAGYLPGEEEKTMSRYKYDGPAFIDQAMAIIGDDETEQPARFAAAVQLMDDDIREALHMSLVDSSDLDFLAAYCWEHEAKYGEPFAVS